MGKYAPEIALLGCTATIVYPRVLITLEEAEKAKDKHVDVEVVGASHEDVHPESTP